MQKSSKYVSIKLFHRDLNLKRGKILKYCTINVIIRHFFIHHRKEVTTH